METHKYQAPKKTMKKFDSDFLTLSLAPIWLRPAATFPPRPPQSSDEAPPYHSQETITNSYLHHPYIQNPNPSPNPNPNYTIQEFPPQNPNPNRSHGGPIRRRRNSASRGLKAGKTDEVPAKFPWGTNRRAGVKSLSELSSSGIERVVGEVQCRRCEKTFSVEVSVGERFSALREFIAEKKEALRDRSAAEWDNPAMVDCRECGAKESAKGVVAEKKRDINWLFLLLGGFLCCCTLEQLKYFCKHTGNHRTGAKNRVLYLSYLALCKQLDPSGPFDALESL